MGVLVAGGTGALGAAVVHELLDAGHAIVATWIVPEERERLASLPVELVEADLFDASAAEAAVAAVKDLDAVVDLVGGFKSGPRVHETDPDEFEGIIRLNLTPAFTLARAAMPRMMDPPANREAQPDADWSKWVPPEEVAKVVRFLVSDESGPTSGAAIPVYGR